MPAETLTAEPEAETNAFQGFATHDGEVVTTKAPASDTPAGKTAKAATEKPAKATKPEKVAADTDDDAGDAGEGDGGDKQTEQRHKSAQQRINKAVAAQRSAERRAEAAERQIQAMNDRFAKLESRLDGGDKQTKRDPNAPRVEDYDLGELDPKFIADTARYAAKQEMAAEKESGKQQQLTAEQQRQIREFETKRDKLEAEGLEKYDDFSEVVFDDNIHVSPLLVDLIFDSDYGADIAYELASDPKEAKKVSAMSPSRQAAWFGKREAEWESSASSDADEPENEDEAPQIRRPSKTTQAPQPLKHKARGSGSTQPVSGATTDFAAFEKAAMKQQ